MVVADPGGPIEPSEDDLEVSGTGDQAAPPLMRGVGRDVSWMVLQLAAQGAGQLLVTAIAVRQAGAAAYGEAALVLAVGALVSAVDAGLGAFVIRSVARAVGMPTDDARRRAAHDTAASQAVYCRLAVGCLALAAVAAAVSFVLRSPFVGPWTIVVGGAGVAVHLWGAPATAVATGLQRFPLVATATCVGAIANLSVVWTQADDLAAEAVALGFAAGVLVQRLLVFVFVRRSCPWIGLGRASSDAKLARQPLLRYGGPLIAAVAVYHLMAATDLVVLSIFATGGAVGVYRAATLAPTWIMGALFRVFDVAFPALAGSARPEEQLGALRFLSSAMSLVGGVLFGLLAAHSDATAIALLGQPDGLASDVILIYAVALALNVPGHGLLLLLMVSDRHHVFARVTAIEGVANLLLTVVLTSTWSPVGAAVATLLALGGSSTCLLPYLANRRIPGSSSLVHRAGLPALGVGLAVAFAATAVSGHWFGGLLHVVASVGLAGGAAITVGWRCLDETGRTRLIEAAKARG